MSWRALLVRLACSLLALACLPTLATPQHAAPQPLGKEGRDNGWMNALCRRAGLDLIALQATLASHNITHHETGDAADLSFLTLLQERVCVQHHQQQAGPSPHHPRAQRGSPRHNQDQFPQTQPLPRRSTRELAPQQHRQRRRRRGRRGISTESGTQTASSCNAQTQSTWAPGSWRASNCNPASDISCSLQQVFNLTCDVATSSDQRSLILFIDVDSVPSSPQQRQALQTVASLSGACELVVDAQSLPGSAASETLAWILQEGGWSNVSSLGVRNTAAGTFNLSIIDPIAEGLVALDLSTGNSFRAFAAPDMARPVPSLTRLSLANNALGSVPTMLWTLFPALQHLSLDNNGIGHVDGSALQGLSSLVALSLDENPITTLPAALLRHTPNITRLSVRAASIPELTNETLVHAERLAFLDLSYNPLERLGSGTFNYTPALTELHLAHTRMASLPDRLFSDSPAPQLALLNFEGARLTNIDGGALSVLNSVQTLVLRDNRLSQLPAQMLGLGSTTQLLCLDMSLNALESVPEQLLTNASNSLEALFLQNNRITAIGEAALANAPKLRTLNVAHNAISTLHPSCLQASAATLATLVLSDNQLDAFGLSLPALETLVLQHNPLTSLPAVHMLPRLEVLDMSGHRLEEVDLGSLFTPPALRVLDLDLVPRPEGNTQPPRCVAVANASQVARWNTANLEEFLVQGVAVAPAVMDALFDVAGLQLTRLHLGWDSMHEASAPIEMLCKALAPSVEELVLSFTLYNNVTLCRDGGVRFDSVQLTHNPQLTSVSVAGPVRMLNVSANPQLSTLALHSAEVLDISRTPLPLSYHMCRSWGSMVFVAQHMPGHPFAADMDAVATLVATCLGRVAMADFSHNAWLKHPGRLTAALSGVTVLAGSTGAGSGYAVREAGSPTSDAAVQAAASLAAVARRTDVPELSMHGTPVSCGVVLVEGSGGEDASSYAYQCTCASGYEHGAAGKDRCYRRGDGLVEVVVPSVVGAVVLIIVVIVIVSRKQREHKAAYKHLEDRFGQAERDLDMLRNGWRVDFDELRIQGDLGNGSFGGVYRVEYHGMVLALKVLQTERLMVVDVFRQEFVDEIDFLMRNRHENIVRFYGMGEWPDFEGTTAPFILLEYMPRGSLKELLKLNLFNVLQEQMGGTGRRMLGQPGPGASGRAGRASRVGRGEGGAGVRRPLLHHEPAHSSVANPSSPQTVWQLKVRLVYDVASGMAFMHSTDHMHNDLKSANVLVSQDLRAKLTDFGSMRKITEQTHEPPGGTAAYMALEALREPLKPREKPSDVFSFGVLMWEVATQREPNLLAQENAGGGPVDTAMRDLLMQGKRLSFQDDVETPAWFKNLTQECWDEDPNQRPTFDELVSGRLFSPSFISTGQAANR